MKLNDLIKSKTREKILKFYFSHRNKKYYLRELERILDLPVGNIRRELISLEKLGIFRKEKKGNLVYYSLNKESSFFKVIEHIISEEESSKEEETEKELTIIRRSDLDLLLSKTEELQDILSNLPYKGIEIKEILNLGVVVNKKGEVLLIKRVEKEKGKGGSVLTWAFPGGKQNLNESRKDYISKEVLGETGYKVKVVGEISMRSHPQFPVFVVYHLCKLVSSKPVAKPEQSHEVSEIRWVKPQKIKKLIKTNLDPAVSLELGLK
jgi:ADP-ribose pyrophosphatase YjhB (NUDIX family)/predicted transcriptional regulator with HTH domain